MFIGHFAVGFAARKFAPQASLGALLAAPLLLDLLWPIFLLIGWEQVRIVPAPPNETALAYFALSAWIVIPWVWWFDRHRTPDRR
jgi:hypothetical protein